MSINRNTTTILAALIEGGVTSRRSTFAAALPLRAPYCSIT